LLDAGEATAVDGPRFLSFGTNVVEVTQGETITFAAVLTDPDGIDDLIGGSLASASGSVTYGAFATNGQEGAYSLTVSWDQINATSPFRFTVEESRSFTASFFDVAGNKATQTIDVRFHCSGYAGCDGTCVDLQTGDLVEGWLFEHCGECGTTCDGCIAGECARWEECRLLQGAATCNAVCAGMGKDCDDDACGAVSGDGAKQWFDGTCSSPWGYPAGGCAANYSEPSWVSCCCL
jgi:hypothetical protein